MLTKLAWRNIWRNKRRTWITIASILFAVLFGSFMESLQEGAWNNMISNVVNYYMGYGQIHQKGYWEEQVIDKAFALPADKINAIESIDEIGGVVPRLESFGLVSAANITRGALVVGVDPEAEQSMTQLADRVSEGAYLADDEQAVLVAEGLADILKLGVQDTLVIISQGYHGVNAAGKYLIKGLVNFGSPELNKQMVYLPLKTAQEFYGADGLLTSIALKIDDQDDIDVGLAAIGEVLDTTAYEIMKWDALLPDLVQARSLDSAGNYIVYFILYSIIAFGIFGTILMMTKEREYEFGVLIGIGMRRFALSSVVWMEIIMLGMLGAVLGIVASTPVIWYFNQNPLRFSGNYANTLEKFGFEPIFPAAFDLNIFLAQATIVFVITALLAVYPWLKIRRLKPVEAMRD
ncbi:MAG: FtsX-like permease family protein [Saprospiraceae bacterium]|nr:FtsX-like permease family protein [Saprospiraceae bacterium]